MKKRVLTGEGRDTRGHSEPDRLNDEMFRLYCPALEVVSNDMNAVSKSAFDHWSP